MSNSLTADIRKTLSPWPGVNVIITAGNVFRHDDGVGPYIAERLRGNKRWAVVDAGYTPENIVDEVSHLSPDNIVVIDAADFGGTAGAIRIIPEDMIPETTLSTHAIPLNVITRLIAEGAPVATTFLGIQPQNVGLGEGLSDPVRAAADMIIATVQENAC